MNYEYMRESSMEDSFVYKTLNSSNGIIEKMIKFMKTSITIDKSAIEEQYMQIKKFNGSPLAPKVLASFDKGEIELLYSKDSKVTISIPFIVRRKGDRIISTIFISSFSSIDKNDGSLTIPVKQLYALMESAYVALKLQTDPTRIERNVALMRICADVYTEMFIKILNKEYAISTNKELNDSISFVIKKFFLTNIWNYPSKDLIDNYSSLDLKYIQEMDLSLLKQEYNDAQIKDINDLIKFLSERNPRMNGLTTRYFIERYIISYHGSALLSMDYLPYLFFVIINIILGSFLIATGSLNDLVKNTKNINRFYVELSKTI